LEASIADTRVNDETLDWDEAYRTYGPFLLAYTRRLTRSSDDAADLVQESFARAIAARRKPSDLMQLRPWLYRIATNLIISRSRSPVVADNSHDVDASQVRMALASIPAEQATALVLRLHEGRSRAEIAEIFGVSEDAVKSRLVRGRANFAAAYRRLERG
jgi:RNA polymerase sigma-70 factor (ECF subfamily)